jgi:Family of unknown function (DUF6176)
MLRVLFFKVRPEGVERLHSWMTELSRRREEVLETFANETVRREVAYLLQLEGGPVLLHVMEADDIDHASRAVQESPLPVDLEHRQVMEQVLLDRLDIQPLFDESA